MTSFISLLQGWLTDRSISTLSKKCYSKRDVVSEILMFRFLYLFLMTVSCLLIPDHNPGDDVLRFDLRLNDDSDPSFCLPEHSCADWLVTKANSATSPSSTSTVARIVWKFGLSPFIKWDAARFLNLAAWPGLRDPPTSCQQGIAAMCDFNDSEQAHAFFPLFPNVLRSTAMAWASLAPFALLPPTFECLLVFSGLLINTTCMMLSTVCLYSLTISILPNDLSQDNKQKISRAASLVYGIWNPANVFFATIYSESLFGALSLSGHAAFASGRTYLAIPLWILASFTRSNGSIHSLWLSLQILGSICQLFKANNRRQKSRYISFWSSFVSILVFLCASVAVVWPIRYHDQHGFSRHCHPDLGIQPNWCQTSSSSFSLYGWTQRLHWNVGIFRYYELKQIPNFLLAAPILGLSVSGVMWWIRASMIDYGKGKWPSTPYMLLIGWPIQALSDFAASYGISTCASSGAAPHDYLICNPKLLGHYAILAGLTLVGLVIAHVQISTRMICSSTPAIIWFLTYCHIQEKNTRLRQFVEVYTALFMLLGAILHVNFLPWT